MLNLHNLYRSWHGAAPLKVDRLLEENAKDRAEEIASQPVDRGFSYENFLKRSSEYARRGGVLSKDELVGRIVYIGYIRNG